MSYESSCRHRVQLYIHGASNRAVILRAIAVFMILVGVAAACGPARHGLGIHPNEALRGE